MHVRNVLRALPFAAPLASPAIAAAAPYPAARLEAAIPAQPLAEALAAFAHQTGLQLVYVSDVVGTRRSHAAPAGLPVREALERLLRGAGLKYEFLTPTTVRILATGTPAAAARALEGVSVEEIIVTANRRDENAQSVPITLQVLTSDALARLGLKTFDDFVRQLPGVTAHGVGPSQNSVYIRGLGTGEFQNQTAGATGSFPSVAIYLDEQSAQLPGRNLDIYTADLERIEVLEGPQGTLFGAGAQAGVLRYITRKPELNVAEWNTNLGYARTAHGGPSRSVDVTVNLPLIEDRLALRAVVYSDHRGGYIDNVPATFSRSPRDASLFAAYSNNVVPPNSVSIDNYASAARGINTLVYSGGRVEALLQVSDDWTALLTESYQSLDAEGVFATMAADSFGHPQPDLTVQLFNPSYNKDRFENTALTIEGQIGALHALYAGSYLVRNIDQVQDYTAYAHTGLYADYYQCINPQHGNVATAECFTPSSYWRDQQRNTHQSHELRLRTPDDARVRAVGGIFYERFQIQDQGDWFYLTALPYFHPIGPPTGYWTLDGQIVCGCDSRGPVFTPFPVTSNNPNVRPPGDAFLNDVTRGYSQQAAFASVDVDLVPSLLTVTAGTRYFRTRNFEVGSVVSALPCQLLDYPNAPNPCLDWGSINLDASGLRNSYSGFRSRANLSVHPADDVLVYYTWSQGFRAGGFNKSFGTPYYSPLTPNGYFWQAQAAVHNGWATPVSWQPDDLTNNEIGWKAAWANHRVQWTGALYQEDWRHAQSGAVDVPVFGGATTNGGDYRIRGVETAFAARVTGGLSLDASAAWNHSELVRQVPMVWADGHPIDFSTLQTMNNQPVTNPSGALGNSLAGAPPLQFRATARYELAVGDYSLTAQAGVAHQSHSVSSTDRQSVDLQGQSVAYDLPPFTTVDGALSIGRGAWSAQLYANNLTDARAQLFATYSLGYKAVTVNRPRTIGLRFTYGGRKR